MARRPINDRLHDLIVHRQIDLIEAANDNAAQIIGGPMEDADEKLIAILAALGPAPTPFQIKRLEDRIRAALSIQERRTRKLFTGYITAVAGDELEMMLGALERVFKPLGIKLTQPNVARALARVREAPIRGVQMGRILQRFFRNDRERVLATVRAGISDGQTPDQIRRAVVGTVNRRKLDGVRQVSRRSVEAISQTVTTHASTQTRSLIYDENTELISKERWVSTLDSKTSSICQSLDGNIYPVGKGIHPPAHPNCRSARMPIVPDLRALPVDPETQTVLPATVADSFDGQGPQVLTYTDWLRTRPEKVQRRILGPTRFALFKTGEIGPRGFVNDRGKKLTIDELRARHADLFEQAGLNEE